MHQLWNTIKGHAANQDAGQASGQFGIVKSVDPGRATVRVAWDEDGTLSGWLPVAQLAAGGAWSGVCLPVPGTQVFCSPHGNDQSSMVVLGAVHSTEQVAGKPIPYKATDAVPLVPGEVTFMHKDGASLRLTASGVVEIHGTLKVDGDILASGDITDLNGRRNSLDYLREQYDEHRHLNTQPGSGTSGLTDKPTP